MDYFRIKNFCRLKDTVKKRKRQATDGEEIHLKDVSHMFNPQYIKVSYNSIIQ